MKLFKNVNVCKDNVKSGGGVTNVKSFLILYKNHGKFYQCRDMDAYIMNLLFGYKVLKDGLCGFPDNSLSKVLNTLEDAKISYQIIEVDKNPIIKDFDKLNNYPKYLDLALKNLDKRKRLDYLIDNLNKCSNEKLEQIMGLIENEFR